MRVLRGRGRILKKNYDINQKGYLFSRKVKKSLVKRLGVDNLILKEYFNGKKSKISNF